MDWRKKPCPTISRAGRDCYPCARIQRPDPRLGAQMIDRRRAVRFVFTAAVLGAACSLAPAAPAQESFQRFYPFLIDLQGWTGKKPEGFTVEMPGNSMTT